MIFHVSVCGSSQSNEYSRFLPDLGDTDRARLSPVDADFLGRQIVQDIYNQGAMLNDYDALSYLNDIGSELASYSPLSGQSFNFYLIKDKEINAFALPGGYICLYNGLLYTAESESELASVMAHEIGHVVQHHIFRNIGNYNRSQWLSMTGVLAGALLAAINPAAALLAITSGQGIAIQNMLSFSRDFEREADRVGQKIMYNAGFNPHAMPLFFERMQDQNRFNNNEALAFLQTHPVTSERISEALERADQLTVTTRPNSLSFMLVREKSRTRQLGVLSAIAFYQQKLIDLNYKNNKIKTANLNLKLANPSVIYYGLSFAQMAGLRYTDALVSINRIDDASIKRHPAYFSLKAQILTAIEKYNEANKVYTQALESYPNYKGLWLGQIDMYIKSKDVKHAAIQLDDLSQLYPDDGDIWSREALIYSDLYLNNKSKYHYALGNQLFLKTNYRMALDQYQLALKNSSNKLNKSAADGVLNNMISSKIIDTQNIIRIRAQYGA